LPVLSINRMYIPPSPDTFGSVMTLKHFGYHWENEEVSTGMKKGSNKMEPPLTPPMTVCNGQGNDSTFNQQEVWNWMGPTLTRPKHPIWFFSLGLSQR